MDNINDSLGGITFHENPTIEGEVQVGLYYMGADSVLKKLGKQKSEPLIPKLSSNSGSNGYAFASTEYGDNYAWKCFDQNTSTAWGGTSCSSSGPQYIGYTFNEPVSITNFLINNNMPINHHCETFRLEASNDNFATIDVLFGYYQVISRTSVRFYVDYGDKKYKSYRLSIIAAFNAWAGLCEMQLYS